MRHERSLRIRIFTLGFCCVCAQALFVREILGVIAGTELILGLLLAGWLFWIAAGGIIGGRIHRHGPDRARRLFGALAAAAAALVPATVLAVRAMRGMNAWPTGALPPFGPAVAFSIAVSAPFAIVYGLLYNAASTATARHGGIGRGITTVYVLEAGGSAAGAVLFSLLLAAYFTQMEVAVLTALAVAAVFAITARARRALLSAAVLAAAAAASLWTPALDRATMARVLRGYSIERIVPSKHGELCVARDRETVSIFSGMSRVATIPASGELEETVHIPLLAHPEPRSVLLIGGAVGGGAEEARRHPRVQRIDWIEVDPALAAIAGGVVNARPQRAEADTGAELVTRGLAGDGRFMLSRTREQYDVIVITTPAPLTLRWNRYYTEEFFRIAAGKLSADGVLAISHISSENYLSRELIEVLAMIQRSLRAVFPFIAVIPGTSAQFLASREPLAVETIPERLRSRRLETRYVREEIISFRIMPERLEHFERGLSRARLAATNTDAFPALVLLELALEGARAGTTGTSILGTLVSMPAAAPPVVGAALLCLFFASARRQRIAARAAVFSVGLCGMLLQVTAMLAFQSFSGLLHHVFILMTALFMAGAAAGAGWGGGKRCADARQLRVVHAGCVLLAAAIPLWLRFASAATGGLVLGSAGFLFVSAAAGFLGGAYYRVVVHGIYARHVDEGPAVFYAYDLFGAVFGGLLAGLVMLPVAGTIGTAAFIGAAHIAAAILVAGRAVRA